MNRYTDFLFARPSFLEGMARILDLGNTLSEYNESLTPEEADTRALRADWKAVGSDIQRATVQARSKLLKPTSNVKSKKQRNRTAKRLPCSTSR